MGLFVSEDGRYQGWLAALLCCWAAVNDDEYPQKKSDFRRSRSLNVGGTCNEQPMPLAALSYPSSRPNESPSFKTDETLIDQGHSRQHSFNFDEPQSTKQAGRGRLSFHGRRKSSSTHTQRPSIGTPQSFRRIEFSEAQRASLVPLRLGPVVLSQMPSLDSLEQSPIQPIEPSKNTRARSDSTQGLLSEEIEQPEVYRPKRASNLQQRETPFQRCQAASQHQDVRQPTPTIPPATYQSTGSPRPPLSTQSSSSSLCRQAVETRAVGAVNTRSLSSERKRPSRKRSLQSIRKPYAESGDMDLDKEILELNTIVEERRAEASRSKTPEGYPPTSPAQGRARTETLSDIGSAFYRAPIASQRDLTLSTKEDERITRPNRARTSSRGSSRVSGWLSGIMQSPQPSTATPEPFYKCVPPGHQRGYSEFSLVSSVSELESPSLTIGTSPTSKAHSRSLTADSRLTSLSPPSTAYDHNDVEYTKDSQDQWRVSMISPSQVGVAI